MGAFAELAVEVLCNCYMHQPAHALSACAVLLRPDSNQPLPVRIAAVRGERQLPHMPRAWCAQPCHVHPSACPATQHSCMGTNGAMLGQRTWVLDCTGMQSVAMQHLGKHANDRDAQAALWTMPALEALLFALTNDGSVRMRRAAMEAASSVKVSK